MEVVKKIYKKYFNIKLISVNQNKKYLKFIFPILIKL